MEILNRFGKIRIVIENNFKIPYDKIIQVTDRKEEIININ